MAPRWYACFQPYCRLVFRRGSNAVFSLLQDCAIEGFFLRSAFVFIPASFCGPPYPEWGG